MTTLIYWCHLSAAALPAGRRWRWWVCGRYRCSPCDCGRNAAWPSAQGSAMTSGHAAPWVAGLGQASRQPADATARGPSRLACASSCWVDADKQANGWCNSSTHWWDKAMAGQLYPTWCRRYVYPHQTCKWEESSGVPRGSPAGLPHMLLPCSATTQTAREPQPESSRQRQADETLRPKQVFVIRGSRVYRRARIQGTIGKFIIAEQDSHTF